MPTRREILALLDGTEAYLTQHLLPFWLDRALDREAGGLLTYFDRDGRPGVETDKPFIMQIRMLYTLAAAHRAGYGGGRAADAARHAADFILAHYWDETHDGWIWLADRAGRVKVADKIGYGQCFGMYSFAEYFLATGDRRGFAAAERTFAAVSNHMLDSRHGGYLELFGPDWQPAAPGRYGGDRKSLDIHMHMMEALTTLYEMTGRASHRRRLEEIIDLIIARMLHPQHGTGFIQYALDFTPLPAIIFATRWGRDADPEDKVARPLDFTSFGHNLEFVWLLLHAADVLGQPRSRYAEVMRKIADHTATFGVDWERGGLFVEGPHAAPTALTEKQFWQPAEALIGFLDAYALLGDEQYWRAFRNVHDFVMAKFVNLAGGGEWFERLDREGRPIDAALGHAYKCGYHTVRSMIQTVARLRRLAEQSQ
jgi:mannobiose 2-epimerase